MKKQRILIITRNLPPLVGGMERLNWHMADELAKYAEVRVIGPQGSAAIKPDSVSISEAPLKPLPLFLLVAFVKALRLAISYRPHVVLAGSGLTAPLAWLASKACGARSAAYLHGLDITAQSKAYQRLWVPIFKKMDVIIVNSTPTRQLAFAAGVPEAKMNIIYPGVSLPEAPQSAESIAAFKQKNGLENKKVLLSVGRLTTRKGLREFVEHALPRIVQAEPDTVLVVVGEAPKNSLGAGIQTVESIQAQAEKSGVASNIHFLGVITDTVLLATAYEAADVHVFPVRHIPDDPEGFGMVAIEAAAHGLPTVAFATGGIVDAVTEGQSGYLVEKNNYAELAEKTVQALKHPPTGEEIKGFAQQFAWSNFGESVSSCLIKQETATTPLQRQAHAVTNLTSRIPKAQKIELLLELQPKANSSPLEVLEIGCGSGGIVHYFATAEHLSCNVKAVDVNDNRQVFESYSFTKVDGVVLPYADNSFDVVISNHVIEHVGMESEQLKHIQEIKRVLKPEGTAYLAVPNRWMLTEPHYRLKFLSWWPKSWRSPYLRMMRKGNFYDCEPLQMSKLENMLKIVNVGYENISVAAIRITFALEKPDSLFNRILKKTPDSLLSPLRGLIPTLIYKISKESKHD